ncbi:ProQ/FINO family protein [Avibacterium paragallinarum]|uniref:ProP expression regulator n=1 Tax=Avibacterium paragallinarum TaxID=728 RepID=A0A0F5EUU5_AVIPA|nr:ProQ/FINO family protein [Avibacterium paragallinarum]KAA6208028.1 hypothetical protein F1968_11560 [Avibacterium paragallinarum]KKB00394.1 hypothetical protein Z012_11515 [Avibacterium paragallinarum]RZN54027.1 hypothetical protein EIG79_12180 [Avibacterium paragallinarum]RZN74060.1 hypothetical protein EIG77_00935 [Avibacterium paragallinarum]UXN37544.1 ProQ/FINO family protein [Avibacterium paragallinarum]
MSTKTSKDRDKLTISKLQEKFPNAFYNTKPLIPEIVDQMIEALADDPLSKLVKSAMRYYMRTPKYLRNLAYKKWLRDINGSKVRLISMEERQYARTQLEHIRKRNSLTDAEYRFAQALAKESKIDYQKAMLLEQPNKQQKTLVIIKKTIDPE